MEQPQKFSYYASVLLDVAIDKPLDYGIPHALQVKRGMHIEVPLRGALRKGYVIEVKETSDFSKVLPVHSILSEEELLTHEVFELAIWISRYYGTPLRQVIKPMLPAAVRHNHLPKQQFFITKKHSKEKLKVMCESMRQSHPSQAMVLDVMLQTKKGIFLSELLEKAGVSRSPVQTLVNKNVLHLDQVRVGRSPLVGQEYFKTQPKTLNAEQAQALQRITQTLNAKTFETHLLFGVTGSGKTEVYLQAIDQAMKLDQGTIMLIPEIALTAQTIQRFRARFDQAIAILHHRLGEGERRDEWYRIRKGEAKIVIGARSALFSPIKNLGLIIVDEEHDSAYKQSERQPCYHARDLAVLRGKLSSAAVVLGTATPSLESYYNAQVGKYTLSTLTGRATKSTLPKVHIIDMRQEFEKAGGFTLFSDSLIKGIQKRLDLGEQSLIFLNRRGYHTSLYCQNCSHIFKCPHCDLALTFHRGDQLLACHMCDYRLSPPPKTCTSCQEGETLKYRGSGTEQVQRALHALFPEVRTLRVDGDTTKHKGSHERLFRDFSTGKADILIGTQMITKGLHFPAVTLVAILNGDASLHLPDFRSSEKVFQISTQVAGRAGRGELPGEVFIQTQMPTNHTIQHAANQNFEAFYAEEIETRKAFNFPPFSHLVKLTFSGTDVHFTQKTANQVRQSLVQSLSKHYLIHPVIPSGYAKVKDHYRFQCLIQGAHVYPITTAIQKLPHLPKTIKMHIDVDPLSTFF